MYIHVCIHSKNNSWYLDGFLSSWYFADRPTQSIIYVPLQVNRFQKSVWLIVQYKCLKSCSGDLILQNLILRTRSCGTSFITQSSWVFHFHPTIMAGWTCFVPQLYQPRRGISEGPALKYVYMNHWDGRLLELMMKRSPSVRDIQTCICASIHKYVYIYMYVYVYRSQEYICMYICIYERLTHREHIEFVIREHIEFVLFSGLLKFMMHRELSSWCIQSSLSLLCTHLVRVHWVRDKQFIEFVIYRHMHGYVVLTHSLIDKRIH